MAAYSVPRIEFHLTTRSEVIVTLDRRALTLTTPLGTHRGRVTAAGRVRWGRAGTPPVPQDLIEAAVAEYRRKLRRRPSLRWAA